jgi:hypothetical protein
MPENILRLSFINRSEKSYKKELQKRVTKKSYKKELQKRVTKKSYNLRMLGKLLDTCIHWMTTRFNCSRNLPSTRSWSFLARSPEKKWVDENVSFRSIYDGQLQLCINEESDCLRTTERKFAAVITQTRWPTKYSKEWWIIYLFLFIWFCPIYENTNIKEEEG